MLNRIQALNWIYENLGSWPSMEEQRTCAAPAGWEWSANILRSVQGSIWQMDYTQYAQGRQAKSGGLMTDKQLDILKSELIPLFLKSCTPLLEQVIKKRLELFAE